MHTTDLIPAEPVSGSRNSVCAVGVGDTVITVELFDAGIVKVHRAPARAAQHDTSTPEETASPAVLPDAVAALRGGATGGWHTTEAALVGRAGPIEVRLDRRTGLLTFSDRTGVLAAEIATGTSAGEGPHRLHMRARSTEHFYGLGQKIRGANDTSLSWRGRIRSFGQFGNEREKSCPGVAGQGNGNTTIPLLVSTAGYGLFLDNHFRHEWNFTDQDAWSVEASAGEFRYWFIYGPDPAAVLERYTRLTGRAPMPPRWALGLLQSKFGYRNWDQVHAAADAYRERGIPCDAIILDLYWFGGVPHFGGARRIGSLDWDTAAFPDAARHIAALRARGFRTVLIEEPYVDEALPVFAEAAEAGYLARGTDGAPAVLEKWWGRGGLVDMTSPAARAWWWSRHRPLLDDGVAAWWSDLGEPDTFDAAARYHDGASHADVHNRFALEWARALHEGTRRDRPNDRLFQLTRSGYAGIQRHGAALWSNDVMTAFEWLAPQAAAGLNLGLSGVPYWGTDVGGFIGPVASDELYVRWFQFGAFTPVFRTHGQDRPTAPFEFPERVERICGRYARLRYRLLPYIYTAAREAYDTGMPLMRALACEFPDDRTVPDLGAQYLFGPSLMVAPMLEPGGERNVYLPAGEWFDFWTNQVYTGPTWLRRWPAPLDTLPLFVRSGAIIPLGPPMAWTGERAVDPLTLRIYPGRQASEYTLYEDDGETTGYERGACAMTRVTVSPGDSLTVCVGPAIGEFQGKLRERTVIVELVLDGRPERIEWNGAALPDEDWGWDASSRVVTVTLRGARTDAAHQLGVLRAGDPSPTSAV